MVHMCRCRFQTAANYALLLMERGAEAYTAMHVACTKVSIFMNKANYCTLMAICDGAAAHLILNLQLPLRYLMSVPPPEGPLTHLKMNYAFWDTYLSWQAAESCTDHGRT